jgi:hypothetical protein
MVHPAQAQKFLHFFSSGVATSAPASRAAQWRGRSATRSKHLVEKIRARLARGSASCHARVARMRENFPRDALRCGQVLEFPG